MNGPASLTRRLMLLGKQMMELKHEAHLFVAEKRQFLVTHFKQVVIMEVKLPALWASERY